MPSETNSFSRSIPRALRRSSARSLWAAADVMSVTIPLLQENTAEVYSQLRRYRPATLAACQSPLPPLQAVPAPGSPHRTILGARDDPYANAREKSVGSRHVACRRRARMMSAAGADAMASDCMRTLCSVHGQGGPNRLRSGWEHRRERTRKQARVVASEDDGCRANCYIGWPRKGCQRGAVGDRGDVARVSGSASRAWRCLSISGGVARHGRRLRGPKLQSCCLRNPCGSVIWCGN